MTNFFLPKDRDAALFAVKHEMYHRLHWVTGRIKAQDLEPSTPHAFNLEMHLRNEEVFLRDLIDLIERS